MTGIETRQTRTLRLEFLREVAERVKPRIGRPSLTGWMLSCTKIAKQILDSLTQLPQRTTGAGYWRPRRMRAADAYR